MASLSPRRAYTSFGHYHMMDPDDSYSREVVSRQSMHQEYNTRGHNIRPKTGFGYTDTDQHEGYNFPPTVTFADRHSSNLNNQKSIETTFRPPSQLVYRSAPNQSTYRPPSQLAYRSAPIQSDYRSPSQLGFRETACDSAYRPPSHSHNRPSSQSEMRASSRMMNNGLIDSQTNPYLANGYTGMVIPEPIRNEDDHQIFVRKPRETSVAPPLYRLGSHGAPWKHVKTVINSNGSHLCWIDGSVKQDENTVFPMYWNSFKPTRRLLRPKVDKSRLGNPFQQRAKNGFQYWYQDKQPTQYTDYSKFKPFGKQIAA